VCVCLCVCLCMCVRVCVCASVRRLLLATSWDHMICSLSTGQLVCAEGFSTSYPSLRICWIVNTSLSPHRQHIHNCGCALFHVHNNMFLDTCYSCTCRVGQNHVHVQCTHSIFGKKITKYSGLARTVYAHRT
jgi:hypothetical protein